MRSLALPAFLLAATLALPGAAPAAGGDITVFRCVDARGAVTLQDKPCPKTSQATSREMVRPKDAPPRPPSRKPEPEPAPDAYAEPPWEYTPMREPPPPMYVCTSYDGIVRESESYDPNPRCEPLALYYPYPESLSPEEAGACHWVEDSCVRLSDDEACERWRAHRKQAKSDALHADSSTMAYKRSELRRIEQIIATHCD
jgi:hypothetical protein